MRAGSEVNGVAGANLVLRPVEARSNYTRQDGTALVAPGADSSLVVGIGPGLDVGSPPPTKLRVALDAAGGSVTLRVEGTRYVERPDDIVVGGFAGMRTAIDDVGKLLTAILDALRKRR